VLINVASPESIDTIMWKNLLDKATPMTTELPSGDQFIENADWSDETRAGRGSPAARTGVAAVELTIESPHGDVTGGVSSESIGASVLTAIESPSGDSPTARQLSSHGASTDSPVRVSTIVGAPPATRSSNGPRSLGPSSRRVATPSGRPIRVATRVTLLTSRRGRAERETMTR
jgi:hypothetical protein